MHTVNDSHLCTGWHVPSLRWTWGLQWNESRLQKNDVPTFHPSIPPRSLSLWGDGANHYNPVPTWRAYLFWEIYLPFFPLDLYHTAQYWSYACDFSHCEQSWQFFFYILPFNQMQHWALLSKKIFLKFGHFWISARILNCVLCVFTLLGCTLTHQ